ncbi:Methyltransferase domain family protein [Babesia bovis T2Bo]|uniref:Methyltransferase domain family protein n=1 Tax=Babesia bovis T2Bo TaxID=484906 RepID=UPI001C350504|nr:Methyltransferase domain family protein [Babesia bovis T2Bo]EDO06333.2 Methyltransferase domain family protein [Babesia bovis T2Bo]
MSLCGKFRKLLRKLPRFNSFVQKTISITCTITVHIIHYCIMEPYSTTSYWNQRYNQNVGTYEWYTDWLSLKSHLPYELNKDAHVLHIGCGTSKLAHDLYEDGIRNVKNIDISPVCIGEMKKMFPHLDYDVMDVLEIGSHYSGDTFDVIIDKGCLDTLLCYENFEEIVPNVLKYIHGLLRESGFLLLVSLGCPENRMMYLEPSQLWDVSVIKVPKNTIEFLKDAHATGNNIGPPNGLECHSSSGSMNGSSVIYSRDEWLYYYIYICHKRI